MRATPGTALSIRALLLVGTSVTLLAVLGAAAWLSYSGSEEEAQELFDARLATSARVLEVLVARQVAKATVAAPIVIALPGPLEATGHDAPGPLGHYYETKIAFQVRDGNGRVVVRSASAPDSPFAPLDAGFTTRPIGGQDWRVFTLHGGDAWVQVAERDDVRGELAEKLAFAAAAPLLAGIPLLLVLLSLVIRQGLTPLSALARQVAARRPGSVAPFTLARNPAEIAPLVEALNGLLARVRDALERERRFTADAAHELRTPLAALKVHGQNAARASTSAEREASLQRMLQGLERTIHLAEQMLAYSRAAAPGDASRLERVAMAPLLREALEGIQPRVQERRCTVEIAVDSAAAESAVNGDRQKLLSLVTNLIDNAVRYSPEAGRVAVALRREGDTAVLSVSDDGPGIPSELRERVFESYYRIPGTAGAGGGLGLAIVREIAEAHGARVAIEDGPGGRGTRLIVWFPLA
ncbi:MAG TPA: ATP-binding protein [Burkholderiales bacterium]|jgi:two-component system sensor histidine kinase QseC